ncbi:carbohydrate ABC transporter permease, partial [Jeotgalibaca porci]
MHKSLKKYFPIFVLPTLLAFIIAFLIPFILGVYLSFTEFNTVRDAVWIGFENYKKAFADPTFVSALWFTVKFTVVSVVSINILAFLLALLLTGTIKGTKLYRTVFFMPNLIGGIVLGYVWLAIINSILY